MGTAIARGTYGPVMVQPVDDRKLVVEPAQSVHWRARVRYRYPDGRLTVVQRYGGTKAAATAAVKVATRDLVQKAEAPRCPAHRR